jgi:RNA polymerase-binding transcription factor DksA
MARSAASADTALSARQLATLRAALEQCRNQRSAQLRDAADLIIDGDTVAVAHAASVKRILDDIVSALGRIDTGKYGNCVYCNQPIPYARLEVLPYTTGCVHCLSRRDEKW